MKKKMKRFTAIFLAVTLAFAVLGGCTAQKKPLPDVDRSPTPNSPPIPEERRDNATPEEAKDTADDIAAQVENVPGVEDAYVVVMGNITLIGLDITQEKQEAGTNSIKAEVTQRAESDRRIVQAYVTADPDMVPRIKEISDGVRQGRPISEFFDEISEMINRLAPSGDKTPNQGM